MSLDIFQMEWWGLTIAWVIYRNGNAPLVAGVSLGSIDVVPFKVPQVNNTVRVWVTFLLREAGACKDGKANMEGLQIE